MRNCDVEREKNACLSKYQLQRMSIKSHHYRYEAKAHGDISTITDTNVLEDGRLKEEDSIHVLDEMLALKKFYQTEHEDNKMTKMNEKEQTEEEKDAVIGELDAFEKDATLKADLQGYLSFALKKEYTLLSSFYPNHRLLVD